MVLEVYPAYPTNTIINNLAQGNTSISLAIRMHAHSKSHLSNSDEFGKNKCINNDKCKVSNA